MYGPASYLGCIWSFSFQANCHLRVKFELRFLDAIGEQVLSYSASIPMDQFDRASYDFTSWYLVSFLPGIITWKVGKDSSPWQGSGPGKSRKKSFLAFQHQSPEWDESFRPELKNC